MRLDPAPAALDHRPVKSALGLAAVLLMLSLRSVCGSSEPTQSTVTTGSTTTCVPTGNSFSCSCTPLSAIPPKGT